MSAASFGFAAAVCVLPLTPLTAAAGPPIVFDARPESGIPAEAEAQARGGGSGSRGSLAAALGDSVKAVRVRYYDATWAGEKEVHEYLSGLLAADSTETYTWQVWSQGVGVPEVECVVEFEDRSEGRLLLWQSVGCYRDGRGQWRFVTLFDHFHREHPKGTRRLAPARPPAE